MSDLYSSEPLLDMFLFETEQLLEQLEQLLLNNEKTEGFTKETIDEVFRIMHTIKGSAAMMAFKAVSNLAHCMEDLFYVLRNGEYVGADSSYIADLVFEGIDFIKQEIAKARSGEYEEGDPSDLIRNINDYISSMKSDNSPAPSRDEITESDVYYQDISFQDDRSVPGHAYKAVLHFEDGCEMENIRAYAVVHRLKDVASDMRHIPENLTDNDTCEVIRKEGFQVVFRSDLDCEKIREVLLETIFLKDLSLTELDSVDLPDDTSASGEKGPGEQADAAGRDEKTAKRDFQPASTGYQNILSVDVAKLDKLMDLVGEMVIAEAMVVQNPDLAGLELDNFQKAAQRLDKITKEIQDMVMSIRMVPLAATFQKMKRIVRDMCKKLQKEARLVIIGEDTEVDKKYIRDFRKVKGLAGCTLLGDGNISLILDIGGLISS